MEEKLKVVKITRDPKLEVYQKFNSQIQKTEWRWEIKASNGNTIAASTEGYLNHQDCIDNIYNVEKAIQVLREKNMIK